MTSSSLTHSEESRLGDISVRRSSIGIVESRQSIPLVTNLFSKETRGDEGGEKDWLNSEPFDRITGNPSRERYSQLLLEDTPETILKLQSVREVHELTANSPSPSNNSPDDYSVASSSSSDISVHVNTVEDRIRERKKARHEATLKQFTDALSSMDEEHKSRIETLLSDLKLTIKQVETGITDLWSDFDNEEALLLLKSSSVDALLLKAEEYLKQEKDSIVAFEEKAIEQERLYVKKVSHLLSKTLQSLNSISYLLSHQVCRVIDEEAMRINLSVLGNMRNYSRLSRDLQTGNNKREQRTRCHFTAFRTQWSTIRSRGAENDFRTYINSDDIKQPQLLEKLKASFLTEQEDIRKLLESHLEQLRRTKLNAIFDEHQSQVKAEAQKLEKSLQSLSTLIHSHFMMLFQFAQGAAHIWDTHSSKLDEASRQHKEGLANHRKNHDLRNQTMEANLDFVIDRMRQSSSPEEANEYLKQSMQMLDTIKAGYLTFHDGMLSESKKYPKLVTDTVEGYDKTICKYLNVSRNNQSSKTAKGKVRKSTGTPTKRTSAQSKKTSAIDEMVEQVIATSEGTSFYILSTDTLHDQPLYTSKSDWSNSSVFITQDEDIEGMADNFAANSVLIEDSKFTQTKELIRLAFLEHMEKWKRLQLEDAIRSTREKEEEFKTELELRLHLHEPRPQRVIEDINSVRIVELVSHEERVSVHIKGLTNLLHKDKNCVSELSVELDLKLAQFVAALGNVSSCVTHCTNLTSLRKVLNEAKSLLAKSISSFKDEVSSQYELTVASFEEALSSNNDYIQSLKLFSEGGNYSIEEIEKIRPKLDKQGDRIKKYKIQVTEDIKSLSATIPDRFEHVFNKHFIHTYEYHLADISMIDSIENIIRNCQILIKTEVASSNGQSADIKQLVKTVEQRLEEKALSDVYSSFQLLYSSCQTRLKYLHCVLSRGSATSSMTRMTSSLTSCLSQPPISAIDVTKSILSYTTGSPGPSQPETTAKTKVYSAHSPSTDEMKVPKTVNVSTPKQKVVAVAAAKDRRVINFGSAGGEDGSNCFLPKIRVILTDTHKKLYAAAEEYYRMKGTRAITKPKKIPDSFKQLMDNLIGRCHGYYSQAEQVHTSSPCVLIWVTLSVWMSCRSFVRGRERDMKLLSTLSQKEQIKLNQHFKLIARSLLSKFTKKSKSYSNYLMRASISVTSNQLALAYLQDKNC
uniref:DUF4456 domain-containing protein n=1 Tax=Amphimedon queenslandica TaxID=400682 RepID=A0A1X7V319_AMPQE